MPWLWLFCHCSDSKEWYKYRHILKCKAACTKDHLSISISLRWIESFLAHHDRVIQNRFYEKRINVFQDSFLFEDIEQFLQLWGIKNINRKVNLQGSQHLCLGLEGKSSLTQYATSYCAPDTFLPVLQFSPAHLWDTVNGPCPIPLLRATGRQSDKLSQVAKPSEQRLLSLTKRGMGLMTWT